MIESIRIRNTATYDDSGITINPLKKINFIYGANGSGKTTLSNFVYEPNETRFSDCDLNWQNNFQLKSLVYNKEFRDRNFGKGTIAGVFTLGEATKEEAQAIEEKRKDLKELKDKGIQQKKVLEKQEETKSTLEDEFKEEVWSSAYKNHEIYFKGAFKGVMQKSLFMERVLKEFEQNNSDLKSIDELKDTSITIFGKIPERILLIPEVELSRLAQIEKEGIWNKKIIGKSDVEIASLIQHLSINDWVSEGKAFLRDGDDTCPFCQQRTITDDFRKQLENYFDKSFIDDTQRARALAEEYVRVSSNLVNELQQIENREKNHKDSKLDLEKFSILLKTLNSQLVANKELLNNKLKEPSRSISITSTVEQLNDIENLINAANELIKKHNNLVDNYAAEKIVLISEIWKFLIEENQVLIKKFNKKRKGLERGISNLSGIVETLRINYKELDDEIKELTKNVTSIQPSIDEINRTLGSFGFHNFKIVPSTMDVNQYQIQRDNGELAEATLSEGEITFITFLYFLQLVKGSVNEADISDERVLVIDDPISSLDSNVLFVVSSLLKEIIREIKNNNGIIKQIILLTHNVYFHKEVSFIHGRAQECADTNFWILRKTDNVSSLQNFEMDNPVQNSYELLWKELENTQSGITIQNTMRRIIENYFKILGKYGDDDLLNKFDNPQEREVCRSLLCWINEGSHTIPDDLFVEAAQGVDIYHKVFRDVFEKTKHIEHYNMMKQGVS